MRTARGAALLMALVAICALAACAPRKVVVSPVPPALETGDALFESAEQSFREMAYPQALSAYHQYLTRFPAGPFADAALMKIAALQELQGDQVAARNSYQRLIRTYGGSYFVPEAMVAIVATYYRQQKYEAAIAYAAGVPTSILTADHVLRLKRLTGRSYLGLDAPVEAAGALLSAYDLAPLESKPDVLPELTAALERMDAGQFQSFVDRLREDPDQGGLLYPLALIRIAGDDYDQALTALTAFLESYPDHDLAGAARGVLAEVQQKTIVRPYRVGCLLPLSGPYRTYGQRALHGIEMALNRYSAQAGVPEVSVIVRDSGSDPAQAVRALQELAEQQVAAVIGPIVAAEDVAMAAQLRRLPIVTLTQKEDITAIGGYVFRNFITPAMQVETLVTFAVGTLGVERFAVLYPEEPYGRRFMNLFWDQVVAAGGKVVGIEAYDPAQTDFAEPIKKLVGLHFEVPRHLRENFVLLPQAARLAGRAMRGRIDLDTLYTPEVQRLIGLSAAVPAELKQRPAGFAPTAEGATSEPQPIVDFKAVFIPDAPQKAGLIVPQLAFYDVENVYLLGTNLWHSPELIKMSREYVQGAVLVDGFFADSRNERVRTFVEQFKAAFGESPGFFEATTYDSATMLLQILAKGEVRFKSALKEALLQVRDYPGVTGVTSFDARGEARKQLFLLRVKGRRFLELDQSLKP